MLHLILVILAILLGLRGLETAWASFKWFRLGHLWPVGTLSLFGGLALMGLSLLVIGYKSWWYLLVGICVALLLNWGVVAMMAFATKGDPDNSAV